MKSVTLAAAIVALLCASSARADMFEANVKVTCYSVNGSDHVIDKRVVPNKELIERVAGVSPDAAKEFVFTYAPSNNTLNVGRRCDPNQMSAMSETEACATDVGTGPEPVKYAGACQEKLLDWDSGAVFRGEILCQAQGKATVANGPISAKGGCIGRFTNPDGVFCSIEVKIGKRFKPSGVCPVT